jgi:hypothetical protein
MGFTFYPLFFTCKMQIYEEKTENKNGFFAIIQIFFINFVVEKSY